MFQANYLGRIVKRLTTKSENEYESAKESLQTVTSDYKEALSQGHRKMDAETYSTTNRKKSPR